MNNIRYSSQVFGDDLELIVEEDARRPRISKRLELTLKGLVDVLIALKTTRLHLKRLTDSTTERQGLVESVWPKGLFGFTVPGEVEVRRVPVHENVIPTLRDLIAETGSDNVGGAVESVEIDMRNIDPGQLVAVIAENFGEQVASSLRPTLSEKRLKQAVREEAIIDPRPFKQRLRYHRIEIDIYGPDGEVITDYLETASARAQD